MGRYAAGNAPDADAAVENAAASIGAAITAMRIPRLRGVVLGGGYGRGEGGVVERPDGTHALYNDLDFYVVAEDGSTEAQIDAIGAALAPLAEEWTARLGVDVDFCRAKTPWRIRHDAKRLMVQELVRGFRDVAGESGEALFADVEKIDARDLPWTEAARLLVNRGAGLLLAERSDDGGFRARNINKCVLGAGDATLIARGGYEWRLRDRAAKEPGPLYRAAAEWKERPRETAPFGLEEARAEWLAAAETCLASESLERRRGAFNALRWIARRRSAGDLRTLGLAPEERMLRAMERTVRAKKAFPDALRRDWEVFG